MANKDKQLDKFKQAAKDAECDTDQGAFDRALKKVAKTEPDSAAELPKEQSSNKR